MVRDEPAAECPVRPLPAGVLPTAHQDDGYELWEGAVNCPRCRARCVVKDCREQKCLACGYELVEATFPEEFPCLECSAVFRNAGEYASHKAWHAGNQPRLFEEAIQ